MHIDDEVAINIMIQIMDIEEEPDMINDLRDHCKKHGCEELFIGLFNLYLVIIR